MIERAVAQWQMQSAHTTNSETPSSEPEGAFVGDGSLAVLRAQIDDCKSRIATGGQVLAEIRSQT
jgi:hypothetical protein